MEDRDHFFLGLGAQVDQKISAGNQIEARKGGVGQHILHRENHNPPQVGQHPVTVAVFHEETLQVASADTSDCIDLGIEPFARARDGVRVDVGRKNLKFDIAFCRLDAFQEQHGEGIGFLARAAAGYPDPHRTILHMLADQLGNDFLRQDFEDLRIAKEIGDVDSEILGEKIEFGRVLPQNFEIPAPCRRSRSLPSPSAVRSGAVRAMRL